MKGDELVVRAGKPCLFRKNVSRFSAVFHSVWSVFFCSFSISVILFTSHLPYICKKYLMLIIISCPQQYYTFIAFLHVLY